MKRLLTTIAAIILFHGIGRAQQFPVQVTPQLLPPYSVQVSDYYSPGAAGAKLNLLLLLRDFNKPQLQVRLRMSIEGQSVSIRTREDAVFTPITIESGTPKYIDPSELAQYFNADKLDFSGITRQQYEQTGKLPEGFYTFCFEAIEVATNQSVSNKGCAFAWVTLNEPPILNIPRKAEAIIPVPDPHTLIFQWTPRHTASPTAAFTTDYTFTLVEMSDDAISPEAAFITAQQILKTEVVTATTVSYTAAELGLSANKKYAWRVQAKAKNGVQDLALFRNQGYSETFWFIYQNNCVAPSGASASAQGQRVTIEWTPNPLHLEYKVEYREADDADAQWFEIGNTLPRVSIGDLTPGKTYQYRVGGACEYGRYTFGNLLQFTTNDSNATTVPECGIDPNLTDPPQNLVQTFPVGDTIHAGDYDVIVTSITGQTSFSGEGYVKISWLANTIVAVRFTNIGINTDKKLASGVIETTYDPTGSGIADIDEYIDVFVAGYGVGGVVSGEVTADTTLNFTIQMPNGISIQVPTGYDNTTGKGDGPINVTVTPQGGGNPINYTVDQLPTTLQDKDGNIYQVNKDQQVISLGSKGGEQWVKTTNIKHIDTDKAVVKFVAYDDPKVQYAFDEWKDEYKKSSTFNKEYERLNDDYYVSAKAIAPGKTDYLKAIVRLKDNTLTSDSIQFVNSKGTIYAKTSLNDSTFEISVIGGPEKDAQEIYALYPRAGNKTFNLGKVLVASYPLQKRKLVLVPVLSAQFNTQAISEKLNKIYNKINVTWEVLADENFTYKGWDLNNDQKLSVDGSSVWSSLTEEMKLLNNAYRSSRKIESATVYLFVLNQAAESTLGVQILGDMPRGQQFGYLFTDNSDTETLAKTTAHEIGHGLFRLKHVFDHGITQGATSLSNVMDYPAGENLSKLQWDYVHDPAIVFGIFEKDEDGQNQIVVIDSTFINEDNVSVSFFTENGQVISIPYSDISAVEFTYGSVVAPQQDPRQGLTYHFLNAPGVLHKFWVKSGSETKLYAYDPAAKSYKNEASGSSYTYNVDYSKVDGFIFPMPAGEDYTLYKFSKNGIEKYIAGTGQSSITFGEGGSYVQPFSGNVPLQKNNKIIKQVVADQIYENCYWCRDNNTMMMTKSHSEKSELYYIDKIAQLRVIYPEYFNQFTQTIKDGNWERPKVVLFTESSDGPENYHWGRYLNSHPEIAAYYDSPGSLNLKEYFREFCYQFRDYIDNSIASSGLFWENLNSNTSANDIVQHLVGEPVFQTSKALLEKRKLAIKNLMQGILPGPQENAVIHILSSLSPEDQSSMLDYLASEVKIKYVFDKFHDFFGKNNFTKCITLLSGFINDPAYNQEALKLAAESKYVTVDVDLWDNRQTDGYSITDDNRIQFFNKVQLQKSEWDDPRFPAGNANEEFLTVPYNQLIPVDFWSSFELGGRQFQKRTIIFVPAIYAALLIDKGSSEVFSKKVWLTVDGVLLLVGAGEVKILFSSASWLRKAMIASDIIGSTAGIVNEVVSDDAISPELKNKIRIACALMQLPEALRGITEIANNLKQTSKEIEDFLEIANTKSESKLKELLGMIGTEANYADDAAETGKRIVTLGDDLENTKQWLNAGNLNNDKIYIIAHAENNQFSVLRRIGNSGTADEAIVGHRSLAQWINVKGFSANQDIVLLSCANIETAQNLSNKLGRKIIASDGEVTIYNNGTIQGQKDFMELYPSVNGVPVTAQKYAGNFGTVTTSTKVTLGSSWSSFINDLDASIWPTEMKNVLRQSISETPGLRQLFATATNPFELADAWRFLRNSIDDLSKPNALFKDAKAIQALAGFRSRIPSTVRTQLGITDEALAKIRGFNLGNYDLSYEDMLSRFEVLVNGLPAESTKDLSKFITAGLGNASQYARRSAFITNEYLITNINKLKTSEITFEAKVANDGTTSFTDVFVLKGTDKIHIETKAGDEFFRFAPSSGSNFSAQSFNMLMDANKIENIKVILNPDVLNTLTTTLGFSIEKSKIIDAWKGWEGGKIFDRQSIRDKFGEYFQTTITSSDQLETLLKGNNNWFENIFLNNPLE